MQQPSAVYQQGKGGIKVAIPVFVATRETQGQRENDFCSAPEGGIVIFSVRSCECDSGSSMTCIESPREQTFTSTMKVAMFDGSFDDLDKMIVGFLRDEGWVRPAYVQTLDNNFASRLSQEAAKFPVGTIVEYRDGTFAARQ